jgi:myo-inositol-1(or 4)-monophosphatase
MERLKNRRERLEQEQTKENEITARYDFMMSSVHRLGELAWQHINDGIKMHLKPDGTKVTTADIALNEAFIDMIEQAHPGDLVWGEEKSNSEKNNTDEADKNWMWLIDPIDGTSGFWRSYENGKDYTDSHATIMVTGFAPGEKQPTMSVISNPFIKPPVKISAVHGRTLYDNGWRYPVGRIEIGKRLRYGPTTKLKDVAAFEENSWPGALPDLRNLRDHMPQASSLNHPLFLGSVALADVEISAFPGPSNPHDVAPGALIVHNAGGTVRTFSREDYADIDWRVYPINGVVAAQTPELADALIDKLVS